MNYLSTRNENEVVSGAEAITKGLSDAGGLYVPEKFPSYTKEDFDKLLSFSYPERSAYVLKDFLSEFTFEELLERAKQAYSEEKFGPHAAPISKVSCGDEYDMFFLELWHGPTCAFKDMALQMLPHLLPMSMAKVHPDKTSVILTATSGDTGKAALEGFRDADKIKIIVFYPQDGVSDIQKLQMATQEGDNVYVCAIEGNFDDAQSGVKAIFASSDIKERLTKNDMMFSSANSINWGRIVSQIVYYISSYCDMVNEGEIVFGDSINVVVPTGNFGNILAAYYAKNMGVPIAKLICASNSNDVLTQFINEGVYDRKRTFYTTISPSMDILVSSNLERLLYDLADCESVCDWMKELSTNGEYTVDGTTMMRLKALFEAGCCDDENAKETIKYLFEKSGYLCDPHTAVAVKVYRDYVEYTGDSDTKAIIVSTASPYKFAEAVLEALDADTNGLDDFEKLDKLSEITKTEVPAPLASLKGKEVRFKETYNKNDMEKTVANLMNI